MRSAASAAQTAWEDQRRELCAKAVAQYLKSINIKRMISSLTRAELIGVAFAANAEFIRVTSEKLDTLEQGIDLSADARVLGVPEAAYLY